MGNHNSLTLEKEHESQHYCELTLRLHRDIAELVPFNGLPEYKLQWERDAREIAARFRKEGLSFLTKTLPSIGKAVDTALLDIVPLDIPGFKKIPGTQYPQFLGVILQRIFDADGCPLKAYPIRTILDEEGQPYPDQESEDITVLRALRTLVYFFYKLEVPYDETDLERARLSYVQTEEELAHLEFPSEVEPVIQNASELLALVLGGIDVRAIRPKHGPGAVATGEKPWEKGNFRRKYRSLDWYYPQEEFFFLGHRHMAHNAKQIADTEIIDQGRSKVVFVPKDSRGPRLISCEPLELQWIQQGLMTEIVNRVEKHPLTRGFVNFTNQEFNRELARHGSWHPALRPEAISFVKTKVDGIGRKSSEAFFWCLGSGFSCVTLDMKDASDRVSLKLVTALFDKTGLLGPLKACRSTSTLFPNGYVQNDLKKFAPMGSAVCFPVEAMVFWSLAVSALYTVKGLSWRHATKRVFVYGDDIIADCEDYAVIVRYMEMVGLKFNQSKCCVSGRFRESCGLDAYKGADVTPIRCRKTWSHLGEKNATELAAAVSLSNSLYKAGYHRAALHIQVNVERKYGILPNVLENDSVDIQGRPRSAKDLGSTSNILGWHRSSEPKGYRQGKPRIRWNTDYQRLEIYGWMTTPYSIQGKVNHYNELFRTLVCGSTRSPVGVYAVPHRSRLKRGWGSF